MLGCLAAVTARERRPRAVRPWAIAAAVSAIALLAIVLARGPAGLPAQAEGPEGPLASLPPRAVDLIGRDLGVDPVRKWTVRWAGALRVPESGHYRLWATGRGAVEVDIDGRPALRGEGDPLVAGADAGLTHGAHEITVRAAAHRSRPAAAPGMDAAERSGRGHPAAVPRDAALAVVVAAHRRAGAAAGGERRRPRVGAALGSAPSAARRRSGAPAARSAGRSPDTRSRSRS